MPNKRALIVDDSSTAQYRLKKMLRAYDLHIDTADSGEAALRYLSTNAPDVIFMDHLMPGMDGFRALQIIKSHPETAMIPVIMYTSKSGDVYTGQARALGALDVVSKDTINAADLSKVMEAIHIYRTEESGPQHEATDDQPSFIMAANGVTDGAPLIERRAPSSASIEQARNLELRLSHLEHTLEDSRRFITSRVVRELQGLRHNMKQELSEIIANNHPPSLPAPETAEPVTVAGSNVWSIVSVILILAVLAMVAIYFSQMNRVLSQTQSQQQLLTQQLKAVTGQTTTAAPVLESKPVENKMIAPENRTDSAYLADLAWAFNQSSALQFNQNNIDSKVLIRLHEFISRLINSGFKGSVLISIYVGNFCVIVDGLGQVQLPPDNANMANCMLSSEVYGLDRIMKDYGNDIEAMLSNLSRQQKKAITVVLNSLVGTDTYPDRQPATAAKDWNVVAQANNRLEIRLEPGS